MAIIIPAILTDKEDVYREQLRRSQYACQIVQIDVIDGKFANNKTIGPEVIAKYPTSVSLEIQLMVLDSLSYIRDLKGLEFISRIIVPFEKNNDLKECIYQVKDAGKQIGVSLNPGTEIAKVKDLFGEIDMLLLLGVEPGFSGQKFQEVVLAKIKEAKKISRGLAVEVDGGINFETASKAAEAGADFLAANSVLFKAPDFYLALEELTKLVSGAK
ncbi:MAG: ribulose-phosphate 3-epimerase [Candidatus Curtissbacteria bacterium]|nr:ribulose-phosphate 3-epimerase [Candidatus Curtissbacteria bacterium]